jgi:1-acyl-sn-glycerol-3-phosphate acyltransferase
VSTAAAPGSERSSASGERAVGSVSASAVPLRVGLFRTIARPVFRMLFHILSRVEIEGLGNIPQNGSYLVACNHISIYEPPLVLAFWPTVLEVAAAIDVFDRPQQGTLVRLYGSLPVHRGEFDRHLIEAMVAMLKAGRAVLIFPEGGRTHSPGLRQAWTGTSYVAARAGVDVIPVGVAGTEVLGEAIAEHRRARLRMRIGEAVHTPPIDLHSPDRKRALLGHTENVMRGIAGLLPETHRGIYG